MSIAEENGYEYKEGADGSTFWYKNGKLHRDNGGPTSIYQRKIAKERTA